MLRVRKLSAATQGVLSHVRLIGIVAQEKRQQAGEIGNAQAWYAPENTLVWWEAFLRGLGYGQVAQAAYGKAL